MMMMMSTNKQEQHHRVRRGMFAVGLYFGIYAAVGFVYPLVMGENLLRTAQRKLGWIRSNDGDAPAIQSCCDSDDRRK
jgi:hypothetical protein